MTKHKIKKTEDSGVNIVVDLNKDEFAPFWKGAYEEQASKVSVKGFRKGKAPKEFLDGGVDKDKAFSEAFSSAVRSVLNDLITENKWTIIDQPRVDLLETTDDGGVRFSIDLTLFPEIELADYRKLAPKILSEKKDEVISAEELAKSLDYLTDSRAKEKLVDREAKEGDLIEADVDASVGGEAVPGASLKKDRFILGKSRFMSGFDKKLEGKKAGETLTFSIEAPKDYWQKDYAGKVFDFTVKILAVYEREVPELTDEFAKILCHEFTGLEDLKKSVSEGLLAEKQKREGERVQIKLIEELTEKSSVKIPSVMTDRMLDGMVAETMQMFAGKLPEGEDKMRAEMRKQFKDEAEKRTKTHLVIHALAEKEGLVPTKSDVEAMAKLQNLDANTYYDHIYGHLQNKKVFDFLNSLADNKKDEKQNK
ncbi:MAG: trigger factor [Candidatus Paceibacterota bacterium]